MSRQQMEPMAIIVAVDEEGGFGKDGKIPWHNKEDFANFKKTTMSHPCIMGRKTYEDMVGYKKSDDFVEILEGRESYVVTRNPKYKAQGATVVSSIRDAVQRLSNNDTREIMILGGEKLYIEALSWVNTIYMSVIDGTYDCDRFFPLKVVMQNFEIVEGRQGDGVKFLTYKRRV